MAAHGAIMVAVVLVGLLAPLGLYYLVKAEHHDRETMSRAEAEGAERRDADDER